MDELFLDLPKDVKAGVEFLSASTNMICHSFVKDRESQDYGAYDFMIGNAKVKFRIGKITPKKVGCFVTFYKRIESGSIAPFDTSDDFDFFVISVSNSVKFGCFVLPKKILVEKHILSKSAKEGKRAFRVYPLWDSPSNSQAIASQRWQLDYFFPTSDLNTAKHQGLSALMLFKNHREEQHVF